MQGQNSRRRGRSQQKSSPIRERMLEDMAVRGYSPLTQKVYVRAVESLVRHYGNRSPELISVAEAQCFVRQVRQRKGGERIIGNIQPGIRFLFEVTFGKVWQPVSPLRQRMLEDMDLCGFSVKTQTSYASAVSHLSRHYNNRSPDKLTDEEIRRYFVYLKCERKLARQTVTIALCGIKFFFEKTLKRDFSLTGVPVPKRRKHLPVVLSDDEAHAILDKIREPRFAACLRLIYGCGLRLGEACRLIPTDIDSARGVVIIRNAKGGTDRQVPLPPALLPRLREFWKTHRNRKWLFPAGSCGRRRGSPAERHIPLGSVQKAFKLALKASGSHKAAHVHSLRHSYATFLLENGFSVRTIQEWLGHKSPATTSAYTHMTAQGAQAAALLLAKLMSKL